MAELRADHDWNFADLDFVILVKRLFAHNWTNTVLFGGAFLKLLDFDGNVDLSLVGKVPEAGLVRKNRLVAAVPLEIARKLVNCDIPKNDLVNSFFVVYTVELAFLLNVVDSELLDDLLDTVLEEPLVREDLLGHETILFEVAVNNFPGVILVNWVHIVHLYCPFDFNTYNLHTIII